MNFIRLVSLNQLKRSIIITYNKINNTELLLPPERLGVSKSTLPTGCLFLDLNTQVGILGEQIDLSELFGEGIDITGFESPKKDSFQLTELPPFEVDRYNEIIGEQLLSVYENNFSGLSDYDFETLKKYAVFCRVTGFFDLDISEIELFVDEKKMTVQVRDTHPLLKGSVEVITW